jgi:hypothetical protein
MDAEQTDDPGATGRPAPGQRATTARRGSRRAGAELPDTPAAELPALSPVAPPTTILPTTGTSAGVELPTTSLPLPTTSLPTSPSPQAGPPSAPAPTNIYRARRPGVAILLVIPAIAVGLLMIRALAISGFGVTFQVGGIIASVCGLASLPFLVAGLYGLVTGAAHGAEHYGFKIWARPPLAYLVVGLAFVLAAGLAIR